MSEFKPARDPAQTSAISPKETPVYKKLGFHTALGTQWFEFSPEKMKDYFYELGSIMARQRFLDDIPFSAVLEMSSLNIDEIEDQPVFGSNLCAILDNKVKDDARADMLQRVCGIFLKYPEYELLRHNVNELVEADMAAANVRWVPGSDIFLKSNHLALHLARASITRETRVPGEEIRVHVATLARRQAGNLVKVKIHLSKTTCFEEFLSILRRETALQNDKGGFTLADGPWKYSVILKGKLEGPWFDLTDETSFLDLLYKLRASQAEAMVIHSVEHAMEREYEQDMKEESERRQNEEVLLGSDGKPFFSSTSYLEYLAMQPQ